MTERAAHPLAGELQERGLGLLVIQVYHPDGTHMVENVASLLPDAFSASDPNKIHDHIAPSVDSIVDTIRKWNTTTEEQK
ncbi:hypothetical protein [Nocardia africana]